MSIRSKKIVFSICLLFCVLQITATAQSLRFSNHREVSVPDYALLRIGPFYSNVEFTQSIGYRYTSGGGAGVDFQFDNHTGKIKEDGDDFPMITTLNFRNYLLMTENSDMDISIKAHYAHYPLETQEDDLRIDLAEEGISGNFSVEVEPMPFLKMSIYDDAQFATDYVDTRGIEDEQGGQKYESLMNRFGVSSDWLLSQDSNIGLDISRRDILPSDDLYGDQEMVGYSESLMYQLQVTPFSVAGLQASAGQNQYASTNRVDTSSLTFMSMLTSKITKNSILSVAVGYSMPTIETAKGGEFSAPAVEAVDEDEEEGEDEEETVIASEPSAVDEDEEGRVIGQVTLRTELSEDVNHEFTFQRGQGPGFSSGFENADSFRYRLNWRGRMASGALSAHMNVVEPSNKTEPGYTDMRATANFNYPLSRLVALQMSVAYAARGNDGGYVSEELVEVTEEELDEEKESEVIKEAEWNNDYETLTSRIGTSFSLLENISFQTYYQRVERMSDFSDLAYSRDIIEARFTYSREF